MQDMPSVQYPTPGQAALAAAIEQYEQEGYRVQRRLLCAATLQRPTWMGRLVLLPTVACVLIVLALRVSAQLWPSTVSDTGIVLRVVVLILTAAAYLLWHLLRRVATRIELYLDYEDRLVVATRRMRTLHPVRSGIASSIAALAMVLSVIALAGVFLIFNRTPGVDVCTGAHFVGTSHLCLFDDTSIPVQDVDAAYLTMGAPSGRYFTAGQTLELTVSSTASPSRIPSVTYHAVAASRWIYMHLGSVLDAAHVDRLPGTYRIDVASPNATGGTTIGSVRFALTP